jgi:hypothetical protein
LLHDIPAFAAPGELTWRVRRRRCVEMDCPVAVFTEAYGLAPPREKLTSRAAWWAVSVMRGEINCWPTSTPAARTTAAPRRFNGIIELRRRTARAFAT